MVVGVAQQRALTALYKPSKYRAINNLITQGRASAGMKLAPTSGVGILQIKRALNKDEAVLILPDQEPSPEDGIKSYFFGQPAYTMTLACRLTQPNTTAQPIRIVLGWARRLGIGKGFAIELMDISQACHHPELTHRVAGMNTSIAQLIRHYPEQYHWEYRRFKYTLDASHE